MSFTSICRELKLEIEKNKDTMIKLSKNNPNRAYSQINEVAYSVGAKRGVVLQLHFPDSKKIVDTNSYGSENFSIVVDPKRRQ
ncbi:MAG: hypothetical protein ACE5KA_08950, partial [Nitrososphaerales archaeon]